MTNLQIPLQLQFLQQNWHYHHRTVKLALISGYTVGADQVLTAATNRINIWQCHVGSLLACHLQQQLLKFDVACVVIVEQEKSETSAFRMTVIAVLC